jgi:hypothetical protein
VLRSIAAPILSSRVRIVAVQACCSSVPTKASRLRLIMSVQARAAPAGLALSRCGEQQP